MSSSGVGVDATPRSDEAAVTAHATVRPPSVSVGELAVFAAAVLVALVALVSLATAHLRVLSLTSVAIGTFGLALVLTVLAVVAGHRPRIVWDVPLLVVLALVAVLAAWFFLPGYHYAAGDRDPGGYVMHGVAMARYGSYDIPDEALADPSLPLQLTGPGTRFLGIWIADESTGRIVPQFYHLWPALLATAWNLRGWGGLSNTTPMVGVLAVLVTVVLVRRVATTTGRGGNACGLVAAALTGVLLSTCMLEVWQAKYPSAEIIAQLLFVTASLGVAIAVGTGWRWPAGIVGILVGIGYLARADGLLIVFVAAGVGAALWVLRRFDGRCVWAAVGLCAVLPYAVWQAYGPARLYTVTSTGISLWLLPSVVGALVVAALVLRPVLRVPVRWINRHLVQRRTQRIVGSALLVVLAALFGLGVARPYLFAEDTLVYAGQTVRSYDEESLYRLAWFFTWPGLVLMLLGVAYVLVRRWRAVEWVVLVPLMLFLPLYGWHALNSTFLMWWGRRFVPTVIIGILVLAALALAWLLTSWLRSSSYRLGRVVLALAGAVLTAGIVSVFVGQSVPLRSHDEWGGSYDTEAQIAALAGGDQGVFLWSRPTYCCAPPTTLFAGPLWLIHDQISVLLPSEPLEVPGYVEAYVKHFADQPVFLVLEGGIEPPTVAGLAITKEKQIAGTLPRWEESSELRPDEELKIPHDITVYRVQRE